ncbi:MAG: hypothetical protein ACI90V_013993 [Bacillariaceae sp.]|jgi:hypothetical protein
MRYTGILSSGGKSIPIAYFGQQNALRLAQLREERDPNHVFSSRGASLLIGDITTVLCQNDKSFRFKRRRRKKCSWVKKKPGRRCKKKYLGNFISKYCPETCGMC